MASGAHPRPATPDGRRRPAADAHPGTPPGRLVDGRRHDVEDEPLPHHRHTQSGTKPPGDRPREQCGEGGLPLTDLYRALPEGIPLSIELRSKRLRDAFSDAGDRAKAVATATRRWLATVS